VCLKPLKFTVPGRGTFRPRHVDFTIVACPFKLLSRYTLCNIKSRPCLSIGQNNALLLYSYSFSNTWLLQRSNTLVVQLPVDRFVSLKAYRSYSILSPPYNYLKLIRIRNIQNLVTVKKMVSQHKKELNILIERDMYFLQKIKFQKNLFLYIKRSQNRKYLDRRGLLQ
jgi:hypothetical protein